MYALTFVVNSKELDTKHEEEFLLSYLDMQKELKSCGLTRLVGDIYVTENKNSLASLYKAIRQLKKMDWFINCVSNVCAFKIDDISDFTQIVKK